MNIFEFLKSEKKSEKIEEFKSKNNTYKDKFDRYRFLMKNNRHENILVATYLIAILVEYLNYSEAVQSLECEHNPHRNFLLEEIYKEIEEMTENISAGKIYVTAFLDFKTFKKFSESLAWET